MKRKNLICGLLSIAGLSISYILCRFVFFDIHGMKQWPTILAIASFVVILLSLIFKNRVTMAMAAAGYLVGFAVGAIFQSHSYDQGGGEINNYWIIWTIVVVVSMVIGAAFDFLQKRNAQNDN